MESTTPPSRLTQIRPARAVAILALVCLASFTFLLYGRQLIQGTPEALHWLWRPFGFLLILVDFMNPAFGSLNAFIQGYLLCAGLALAAIVVRRPGRVLRGALLTGLLTVCAYPFLLPRLYPPYTLYAQPAPGFELRWLTAPANAWTSAFKSAQRAHERQGCFLSLRGWSAGNVLYYRSSCLPGYWAYAPAETNEPRWSFTLPAGAEIISTVNGQVGGGYPERPGGLAGNPNWYIVYQTSRSPDGQWLAAALTNYYGPRDIVVLRARP